MCFFALMFLPEIWDALQAAADADLELAQTIVDSAGIIVSNSDMTLCYDERGKDFFSSLRIYDSKFKSLALMHSLLISNY
jgi:hypothetical protein